MKPENFIKTARELVNSNSGKPRQESLRRATSTAYYALFHTLCRSCADLLVGSARTARSPEAWRQVYRALQHSRAKKACMTTQIMCQFPEEIQDFAHVFVQMQSKRHASDYDPTQKSFKSEVLIDIATVEATIERYKKAPLKDKRAFAAWVVFEPARKN